MSRCIRCKRHYPEPPDEQGEHDCPHCGLTPEMRSRCLEDHGRWFEDREDGEEDA